MKTAEEILNLFKARQTDRGPFFERCRSISQHYDNEVPLPLPELSKKDQSPVANMLALGVDQHANRIASYLPDIQTRSVNKGDEAADKRAVLRRRVASGWWETNTYNLLQRWRARWLVAYSQAPVLLLPDSKQRQPRWTLRTPLEAFPSDMDRGQMQPDDIIFAVTRTVGWLRRHYPQIPLSDVRVPGPTKFSNRVPLTDGDPIEILEYRDGDETVILAIGQGETDNRIYEAEYGLQDAKIINLGPAGPDQGTRLWGSELLRTPNRLGEVPVVIPGRISLGFPKGQMDDTLGLYRMQAQMMAMEVNAVANGIWPDEWLVSNGATQPKIITPADGRAGKVGIATGGVFETRQVQAGLQTPQIIDRLERNIRINGGIPADLSGESASNVRTGRRGANILSEAVDYTIQEHQEILAKSAAIELRIAANIDLTYYRNEKKTFYVSMKGNRGNVTYTPSKIWTEDKTLLVDYAKPGSDINALDVQIGQLTGMGMISKLTAGRMHPDVKDPEYEQEQIEFESLQAAALAALQQGAASGALPIPVIAQIAKLRKEDKAQDLFDAIEQAHKQAQEMQAPDVNPVQPGSPEAQPGIAPPGAGAEAGAVIQPPAPSVDNLTQLLRAVRTQGQVAAQGAPA